MHVDLGVHKGTTVPFRHDCCIVGGGIAGLVLAQRLAEQGFEVAVLEGGGLEQEERSQSLYQAEMAADVHTGASEGRFRTFGGSSTRWGGQLLPYTADVFRPRQGSASSRWPLQPEELESYYDQVQTLMLVGSLPFTEELLPILGRPKHPFSAAVRLRFSKWAPFARRNLAQTIGREVLSSARIHLFTHGNVADLHGDGGRITHARVLNYEGHQFRFEADTFIVAAGTVESSRILLSSPGVPNDHDQVGRYFHDHVSFHAAVLPRATRTEVLERIGPSFVDGVLHTCKIEASPKMQQEHDLLSVMAHLVVEEPEDSGIAAVRNLLVSVQQGKLKQALTRNLGPMLRGIGDVFRLVWASKVLKRRAVSPKAVVRLAIDMEQPGTAENRIRLSEHVDRLGLPKAIVDWRVGEAEFETARRFASILQEEMEAAGFAPLEWTPGLLEGIRPLMADTFHAMGGLRMGTSAATSVVDPDLKVHGLKNLHVASCAVYPSGGSSNPTFTLMALAMRLADHLAQKVNAPVAEPVETAELAHA